LSRPTINLQSVRKKLRKLGFILKRQGKKHEIWDNGTGHIIPLSRGSQDVGKTLLKSICAELGISEKEFLKL